MQTLRATRRRRRRLDPFATPQAVRAILETLRAALPDLIPAGEKELVRLLRAARHVQRYPATDTRRGRPGRWPREDLLRVVGTLETILERETSSHLSFSSFVDHYLRLLNFPADVLEALAAGDINISEASQLARITAGRVKASPAQARHMRAELLSTHLQTKESGPRLRQRVNEVFRTPVIDERPKSKVAEIVDFDADLEDFDPYDPTHLFWDQLKQLGFAFREIRREDVTDEEIEELLKASEPVLAVISRIQRRKEKSSAKSVNI